MQRKKNETRGNAIIISAFFLLVVLVLLLFPFSFSETKVSLPKMEDPEFSSYEPNPAQVAKLLRLKTEVVIPIEGDTVWTYYVRGDFAGFGKKFTVPSFEAAVMKLNPEFRGGALVYPGRKMVIPKLH